MNSFLLMKALKGLLERECANLLLCRQAKNYESAPCVPPAIYLGSIPAASGLIGQEAPFILVQALGGHQDADNFAQVSLALRLCVWHENPEARENDLHNLLALCTRTLLRQRAAALEGKYILSTNDQNQYAPWTRPDEQALQYSEAYILTNWKMQGIE